MMFLLHRTLEQFEQCVTDIRNAVARYKKDNKTAVDFLIMRFTEKRMPDEMRTN
jgi:hypothetical protein